MEGSTGLQPGSVDFGALLRESRIAARLTQEALAERAGVSDRTVRNLERGAWRSPRADTAFLLADALGLEGDRRAAFFAIAEWSRPLRGEAKPAADGPPATPLAGVPVPAGRIIGRGDALSALLALLGDPANRVVTLLGPGGVGKTRLATEAARRVADAGGQVAWVPLESLGSAEEVLPAMARAVGGGGFPQEDPAARIAEAVGGRRVLLVVDNCEHVIEAAQDIATVLAMSPGLRVLATSREALRIGGETCVPVGPLPVPEEGDDDAAAASSPSVVLFLERAGLRGDPAAALRDVRRVVTALDGLPLAIGLAAAQAETMSAATIARLLEQSGIEVLATGRRDLPRRLRSMEAAVRWSCDLLDERARRLLRVLAVFRGGADVELLGDMCRRLGDPRLLRALPALVRASLATERLEPDGAPRVRLLSPIRLFAEAELAEAGEAEAAERAHRETMRDFARGAFDRIMGPEALAGLADMDRERDDLTAALDRAVEARDARDAVALASSLSVWWETRSEMTDGLRRIERALALPDPGGSASLADILFAEQVAAYFAVHLGRHDRWREIVDRMLRTATAAGDGRGVGIAQHWIADVAWYLDGDLGRARTFHERSVATLEPHGETIDLAQACERLCDFLIEHGEPGPGLELAQRAAAIRRARGNELMLSASLSHAGTALAMLGRWDEARVPLLEAAELSARFGNLVVTAYALLRLAAIDAEGADPAALSRAARLVGAADAWLERHHVVLDAAVSQLRGRTLDAADAALGAPERDRLLAEGRALTADAALALAGSQGDGVMGL